MENSTKWAIGAGAFALLGAGAYFYFKGRKPQSTLVQCPNNPKKVFDTTVTYDKDPCAKAKSTVIVDEPIIIPPYQPQNGGFDPSEIPSIEDSIWA